ncbi:MAG: 4Fe-4S binding protein [Acidobacteria bacterium]|nr:4Fe-4S binding protein [Acidobacteriota bacterium]
MAVVETVPERCRTCYTCVRECPAKAIRIQDGQARVIPERCIACGNCVRVCRQGAKRVVSAMDQVEALLRSGARVAAMVAPSFPAEFSEADPELLVGALRRLGFDLVVEVAFGADLIASRYQELLAGGSRERYIATTCPAITRFVEKHHPELVKKLAPIVSPMVAMARVLHQEHGPDLRTVFIGPCPAKKMEAADPAVAADVDLVMTFRGLRELLARYQIRQWEVERSGFDPPHPHLGALFPVSGGMLQAAGLTEDLSTGEVVAADGRAEFVDAIREFEAGTLDSRLLEVLCCQGCVMGAGMTSRAPLFRRRAQVGHYVQRTVARYDKQRWHRDMRRFAHVELSRTFAPDDQRLSEPAEAQIAAILARMGKATVQDELDCGACGYSTCREHAIAIANGLAESEMCLPYTIETLHRALRELASTQEALMQSEKLASMGQLAAGIAHEVNNPLGIVLMYAHLLLDEASDGSQASEDLRLIAEQADRCKKIVAGLLDFARQNKVLHEEADARELLMRALRSVPQPENVLVRTETDGADPACELDPDQVLQVLTNLISNAYAAMPCGGTLVARLGADDEHVIFEIEDTGTGITEENQKKIFEPFFTTKKMGKGTGLGLAVAYGVVKMHRGDISVRSNADPELGPTGTTFFVRIPRQGRME